MTVSKRRGRRVGILQSVSSGERVADVEFVVYRTGPDEAYGRIWALGDLRPTTQVMGSQPSLPEGGRNFVLVTEKGTKIEILFDHGTSGAFACPVPSQVEDEVAVL